MQHIIKCRNFPEDIVTTLSKIEHDKLFVLVDENTTKWCLPIIENMDVIRQASVVVVPANDNNKNLENLSFIWQHLTTNYATRHSLLLNLGGGMITDLGGFAAATFKRGIRYINVPTTLLAAVDAAVGGKTGINFGGLKNEIGAFYPAEYVLLSSRFYATLSSADLYSGFAEMLKHALISSETEWEKIISTHLSPPDLEAIHDMAFESVAIKEKIVAQDPLEKNIRKALNLGHTIGHSFESLAIAKKQNLPHGHAVALGMIAELYISHRVCGFPKEKLLRTIRFIQTHYPLFYIDCDDYDTLFELLLHDKKNNKQDTLFTLLQDVGDIQINQKISKELIFQSLDFYRDTVGL